jgi:hypothetical protein
MKTKGTTQTKGQPLHSPLAAASTAAPVEQTVETLPSDVSDASQPVVPGGTVAPAACCGAQKQQSCCTPSAKASCCGAQAAPGSCGCN